MAERTPAIDALLASRHFGHADQGLLSRLVELAGNLHFTQGEQVLAQGAHNERIYLILKGKASVRLEGEEILQLGPGEMIGEMSVISGGPTSADVFAQTDLEILWFTESQIHNEGSADLSHLLDRVFLSILTDKLVRTTSKAQLYEGVKKELNRSQEELKQQQSHLQTQREILDSVLRSLNEGVVVLEPESGMLHVNAGFLRLMGREAVPSDLFVWPDQLGLYLPDQETPFPATRLPMVTALRGEMVENLELFVQNKNLPEGRWLLATSRPLRAAGGKATRGSVVTFFDYTQKKSEEAALRRAKDLAEDQARAQANFLSMITHELGTPLNAVIGMTDLLLKRESLPEDLQDPLETVKGSGEGLLTMIRNLLEYQQLESDKAQLRPEVVGLQRFFTGVMEALEPQARAKELAWQCQLADDLGAAELDRKRLSLILFNLLDNALKFTAQGEVSLKVVRRGEVLVVEIKDSGIGMDQAAQAQLFQPFQQIETGLARKYPGLGLGLILVKRLVGLMGGSLSLESQPGEGTTVSFELPAPQVADRAQIKQEAAQALKIGKEFAQRYPAKVLVAEDNPANAKLVNRVLELLGYEYLWVTDGQQALDAGLKGGFDLVLMDIQMPEMDGLEATAAILDQMVEPPKILALTANSEDQVRERCFELGMIGYLTKPLRIDQLAEHLIELFGA